MVARPQVGDIFLGVAPMGNPAIVVKSASMKMRLDPLNRRSCCIAATGVLAQLIGH